MTLKKLSDMAITLIAGTDITAESIRGAIAEIRTILAFSAITDTDATVTEWYICRQFDIEPDHEPLANPLEYRFSTRDRDLNVLFSQDPDSATGNLSDARALADVYQCKVELQNRAGFSKGWIDADGNYQLT